MTFSALEENRRLILAQSTGLFLLSSIGLGLLAGGMSVDVSTVDRAFAIKNFFLYLLRIVLILEIIGLMLWHKQYWLQGVAKPKPQVAGQMLGEAIGFGIGGMLLGSFFLTSAINLILTLFGSHDRATLYATSINLTTKTHVISAGLGALTSVGTFIWIANKKS